MKYKQVPFNITLAKRISDGSVCGRILVQNNDKETMRTASYVSETNGKYVFDMIVDDASEGERLFNKYGFNIDGEVATLVIEIPVEDSYSDGYYNANSGIKEMQELQKELHKDGHYHKCKIEPIEYILANNLGFCEGNVVKYITRYKDKGGVDDLRKIKIYVDYLIDELTKD